ncbi:signal transduction histidine kinase [Anseongella ginsenosidimutans]|uniref:histidine kinase n=1 Tax=Anseongella ginsenosidimutans TaxID=496056 RepID=A0A4R3KZA3_9SPHI|nr:ATP-binding protein [Anseongella ginsenosidimutans]QEC51351.1 response regulator [Anseongella ginsenosidimutans]TCS89950.1 signal transduction histidine kinase [Anseongella ginsenosidimutans]
MAYPESSTFIRSVKGKVIIAFLVGCIALGLAWGFSRVAFREMMKRVEQLSSPDERLRMVNDLFLDITQLSQSQRMQALLEHKTSLKAISDESEPLIAKLDSLRQFYINNPGQVHRIDSMKDILRERDRLFINYVKVRSGLISGEVLADQMQSLSGLINNTASQIDSTVITTEKKVSTTTVYPTDSLQAAPREPTGLLGRIFGKKKEVEEAMSGRSGEADTALQPRKIIDEVINIKIDTLALAKQDSLIQAVEELMNDIREDQRIRSARFVNREIELLNAGNVLVNEMLGILQEMEQEALQQTELSNAQARQVIHDSIRRVVITMLVFFLITGVLVYLILTDIAKSSTYQEQLEAAKEEAEYHSMAKQRFLSNMSHELRTPLQSIIGYADLLRQQERPDKSDVEAIYRSSGHLLQVVNEVLDYNRIISGNFTFRNEVVNLRELLEEVIAVIRSQAAGKSLRLLSNIDLRGPGLILADPFRLKQILYNLLGNAVKFTDEGQVSLTVTDEPLGRKSRLTFRVADTGVGIPKEDLSRIFQQYEQGGGVSKQPGTGLGLHIVSILAGKMGGTILVNSEPGKGSVFTLNLKFEVAGTILPDTSEKKAPSTGYRGKVWVVDDDQLILEWCRAVFKKHGVRHHCFNLPQEVLHAAWDKEVDIVLVDIRMPVIDGPELCRRLRERIPENVKIFALTAQALPDEQETVLQQGFDGVLMKPFREADLLKLLEGEQTIAPAVQAGEPFMDLSSLEAMTFGDKEEIRKILDRFVEDTGKDISQIYHSIELSDKEKLLLLLHRMAGRTAQIGAKNLAAQFRITEISLRAKSSLEDAHKKEISSLMQEMTALVKNIPLN